MPNPFKDWARTYGANKQYLVVAQMHTTRMQPGATIAVFVDPQNPVDMAIDWIRTGQLGPPPHGSTPGAGEPGARPV